MTDHSREIVRVLSELVVIGLIVFGIVQLVTRCEAVDPREQWAEQGCHVVDEHTDVVLLLLPDAWGKTQLLPVPRKVVTWECPDGRRFED